MPSFECARTTAMIYLLLTLAACASSVSSKQVKPRYICKNASSYAGQVVGNGHCVSFIKHCSDAPHTPQWRPGEAVLSLAKDSLAPGAIIATFKNGKYPNKTGHHAAIYIRHDASGIWVWDQWLGKPVHQRLIRTRYDGAPSGNTAQAYRVVR